MVGHSGVLSASRMNNAILIILDSVDKANDLVEQRIVIRGEFVSVLPLSWKYVTHKTYCFSTQF